MKKTLVSALLFGAISLAGVNQSYAYTLLGGKYPDASFTYKDGSLTSTYQFYAGEARNRWYNTPTPITYSYSSSGEIDFNGSYFGNTGWDGQCTNYTSSLTGYYYASRIDANYTYLDTYSEGWKIIGVFTHELGHALGLDHVSDGNQVMYPNTPGRLTSYPGNDDINGANYLY